LRAMTIEQLFDTISVRLKQEDVGGLTTTVNWNFTDIDEKWILALSNRTLVHTKGRHSADAAVTVTTKRTTLISIVTQETTFIEQIQEGNVALEGDAMKLQDIFGNLDAFTPNFNIVEP